MRNIVFLFLLTLGLVFASCTENASSTGPGISKEIKVPTSITTEKPILADRFGCNQNLLPEKKVKGWETETIKKDTTVSCGFSDEDLKNAGYTYTGTNPVSEETFFRNDGSGWTMPWEILAWLFFLALGIALLLLILWLLRELFYWLMNQRVQNQTSNSQTTDAAGPGSQGQQNQCNNQCLSILERMVENGYSFTAPNNQLKPVTSNSEDTPAPKPEEKTEEQPPVQPEAPKNGEGIK